MYAQAPGAGLALPARFGRYELIAKIAEGGMATVYLGRLSGPMGFQRPVAVKVMRPEYVQSEDFIKMFLDEARLVARLQHPNVVQLLELGQDDSPVARAHGGFFIVMELLQGESLLDVWYACQERRLMLPYDLIAWIGARASEGLHHAHELKDGHGQNLHIVHRDVNPGNIFVTYDGQVKVIDFGVAKAINRLTGATTAGTLKGKVAYMAPEQARTSQVDRRADVFSLAVTLWELTTDRRLFKRKTDVDTLIAVTDAQVPDPTAAIPDYPRQLWAVLRRALARDPAQRQQSALDLARELDAFAQSQRTVNAAVAAEIMTFLFSEQMHRYEAWLRQAAQGDASEVLRSQDPRKQTMQMQSFDAVPLSARSGGEILLSRADFIAPGPSAAQGAPQPQQAQHPMMAMPTIPMAQPPYMAAHAAQAQAAQAQAAQAHAAQAAQAQGGPYAQGAPPYAQPAAQPLPPMPMPAQGAPYAQPAQAQYAQPAQGPAQAQPQPPQKKGRASTVIFLVIALLALAGIGGFVALRLGLVHLGAAGPAPSASASASPSASATQSASAAPSETAAPSATEAPSANIPTLDLTDAGTALALDATTATTAATPTTTAPATTTAPTTTPTITTPTTTTPATTPTASARPKPRASASASDRDVLRSRE